MDKQREELIERLDEWGTYDGERGKAIYRDIQDAIKFIKQQPALQKDYALAIARIAKLEERIRVADAEEPVVIEYPEYHAQGMYYELDDRPIRDRYEAMRYGWDYAIDAVKECIPDKLYLHAQIPAEVELKDLTEDGWCPHGVSLKSHCKQCGS